MEPQVDPPVPYLAEIQGGFTPGKMVRIQGCASAGGDRIDINFQTSANTQPRDDIGLHISVRLLEGYIARNSIRGGVWGEEDSKGELPIHQGQRYEIIVLSDSKEYKIAINGKHFGEFPQRIPVSYITHLTIEGDTTLSLISFESINVSNQSVQAPPPQQTNQAFGPPASAPSGNYGPEPGYGGPPPPQNYGPPQQQGYGPPQGYGPHQQPGYGPPPGYGQGYGRPPPPPGSEEKSSGLEDFFESAAPIVAGVISSGVADRLIGSIAGGGGNQQQSQQQAPQPQQQQAQPPQQNTGGSDVLSSIGSIISNMVTPQNPNQPQQFPPPDQQRQPQQYPQPNQQQPQQTSSGGADILSGIGSLLSTITTPQNPNQQAQYNQQPVPPQQRPVPLQQDQHQKAPDYLATIGGLISNYAASQNQQKSNVQPAPFQANPPVPQQPPPNPQQSQVPDYVGTIGSLISNYASNQNQKSNVQQTPNVQPAQPQSSASLPPSNNATSAAATTDVIGGITSLLSNLSTTNNPSTRPINPPPQESGIYPQLPSDVANSQNPQQPQRQYQQPPPPQADTGVLGGIGSLLSSFATPTQSPHPSNFGGQGSVGSMGTVGNLLTSFAGQMLQPPDRSGQHQ